MLLLLLNAALADDLTLSYDEALTRAVERNLGLLGAEAAYRAAEGSLLVAQGVFEPTFSANYGYTNNINQDFFSTLGLYVDSESLYANWGGSLSSYLPTGTAVSLNWNNFDQESTSRYYSDPDNPTEAIETDEQTTFNSTLTASVTQSLLQGFKTTYNLNGVRTAQRSLTQVEADILETHQRVLADTATAYWALYYQNRLVEISTETVTLTEEERRVVAARIDRGDLAPVERSRVEAAVLSAKSDLLNAQNSATSASETLLLLLGESAGGTVTLTTSPEPVVSTNFDAPAILNQAMSSNPGLLQLRVAEENAEANFENARHARLPELSGTASYTLFGQESTLGTATSELLSGDLRQWYVGADLTVPLGNRVDRGAYEQQLSALDQARTALKAQELTVEQLVRAQLRAVNLATLQIELAEANLRAAEDTLNADRALRDAGRAIQRDVLESIRDFNNARVAVEKSRADYNLSLIELSRLRGAL
ncbi:MAG: outer membrane protein TolC [Myxococcota bacterium]|jgi:outer membrane protein TolC